MVDGAMPKPLQDLTGVFLVAMVAAAVVLGWFNSRDWLGRKEETSGNGLGSNDGPHHHGWWGSDGHHDDNGGAGH